MSHYQVFFIEIILGFSPFMQANAVILPSNTSQPLPFTSFIVHHSQFSCYLTVCNLGTQPADKISTVRND